MKQLHLRLAPILALMLVLSPCLLTAGCTQPSHAKLVQVAGYGQQISGVITANETLPAQLFAAQVITAEARDQLSAHLQTAKALTQTFNAGMTRVLASEQPAFGDLVGTVAQMIAEAQSIRGLIPNQAAQKVLNGFEVGLRAIANYFAVQLQQARSAGLSDAQIAAHAGLPATGETSAQVAQIVAYANRTATHPADNGQ